MGSVEADARTMRLSPVARGCGLTRRDNRGRFLVLGSPTFSSSSSPHLPCFSHLPHPPLRTINYGRGRKGSLKCKGKGVGLIIRILLANFVSVLYPASVVVSREFKTSAEDDAVLLRHGADFGVVRVVLLRELK